MPWRAPVERLYRRVSMMVGFGRTTTATNEAAVVSSAQVTFGPLETRDATKIVQSYGFASALPVGTDVVVVFVGGDRSNGVVVATNHKQSRPQTMQTGDVCVFDDRGQSVTLTAGGIVVNGGGLPVKITNTPSVRMETTLNVTGEVVAHCDSGPVHLTTHDHSQVKAGGDVSGPPVAGS